ncbi:MAG: ABC transporter ATP-binding protein [Oscillospiraceae bacterium]|nr:ABC transporter ATP-binding protein [Oscillospiraceae bacterium]
MNELLLSGEGLVKDFPLRRSVLTGKPTKVFRALDGVSIELRSGETLGIVGESGSGKSTAAELLGDLQKPSSGAVRYKGEDIRSLSAEDYAHYRRNVQFIFQDPMGSMNPHYRIESILAEPLLTLRIELDAEKRREKARRMCAAVGLDESILGKYPSELSGGQCQRVAIARALITEPEVLVCDEAVSALDVSVQAQILNQLRELQRELHHSYIFISHDIGVISFMSDRIAVMQKGKLIEYGPAKKVLSDPQQEYTKQLLKASFARREEN